MKSARLTKKLREARVVNACLKAFGDELSKIAGLSSWVSNEGRKAVLRLDYHFSPKAGPDRWVKFLKNVADPTYLQTLVDHPLADNALIQHATSLHDLSKGQTVGKVYSAQLPGRSYEIKKLSDGSLGCTCPDWRYVGTMKPKYKCKHILTYEAGKVKAED